MGHGAQYPDFIFDAVPYSDMLLAQLGLQRWRKGRNAGGEGATGWSEWMLELREWVPPYTPVVYRTPIEEYEDLIEEGKSGAGGSA